MEQFYDQQEVLNKEVRRRGYVVVGHPVSDIGKGWLTAALAGILPESAVVKIDPMLEFEFPQGLGREILGNIVTDDSASYESQGIVFNPEQNIMMGEVVHRSIGLPTSEYGIVGTEVSKRTWADIAYNLANQLSTLIEQCNANSFVIEVGGCPDDRESEIIPLAIRHLNNVTDFDIGVVLITKYDTAIGKDGVEFKTRGAVRAIETTMSRYWGLPLASCFVRRDQVPESITDGQLSAGTEKIAFKTGVPSTVVHYLPNVPNIDSLREHVTLLVE